MHRITTKLESIDLEELLAVAIQAGEAIMDIYQQPFDVIRKQDGSPLTIADRTSNQIISDYLVSKYPIPILSEENEDISYHIRKDWTQLWVIDPLDGTKEFINKRREFTVNIALVENGRPILGIIYAPVFKELYYALRGTGCYFRYRNKTEKISSSSSLRFEAKTFHSILKPHIKVILSRSHSEGFIMEDYIQENNFTIQALAMGSSLKYCRIAHGLVDLNIRMKPTSEWDTAAAQIIMEEAGRHLVQFDNGSPLVYNKVDILNPYFVAY